MGGQLAKRNRRLKKMGKLDKLSILIPMELVEASARKQIYDALGLEFLIKLAVMPFHANWDHFKEAVVNPATILHVFEYVHEWYIGYDATHPTT